MAILTATEVTVYSNISASAATIVTSGLIPVVQERVTMLTNNYFLTDLHLQDVVTFNATNRTIIANNSYADQNFLAADDIYVYNSYRNDGYYTIDSVSASTITVISGQSVVDELSGKSVLVSVVKWPVTAKQTAALMVAFDYDSRDKVAGNINSRSLGPFSESFSTGATDEFGYPKKITSGLDKFRMVRIM